MRTLVVEFQGFEDNAKGGFQRHTNSGTPGKLYEYLYTGNRNVRAGDYALVHNGTNFGITKITRVRPGITDRVTKHVITVVTQEDFQLYLDANKSIVSHREVFDQLDYLLEQNKKMDKYKDLAERDPYAKSLLDTLTVYNGPTLEHIDRPFTFDDPKVPTPAPVEPETKESIPAGVFWAVASGNFYSQDGIPQAPEFRNRWLDRRMEFPKAPVSS